MEYQPVVIKSHARPSTLKHSPESRRWRQFKNPVFVKEYAPVTSVHFSSSKPHRYAVTAATRVQIYAPRTQKITKTISRFKDVARSGNIREDGKLVVAGDDSGLVQVRASTTQAKYSSGLNGLRRSSTLTRVQSFVPLMLINSPSTSQNFLPYRLPKYCHALTTPRQKSGMCPLNPRSRPLRRTQITCVLARYQLRILTLF